MYTAGATYALNEHPGNPADHPADEGAAPGRQPAALTVVVERSPAALARVYSILCLMNLVPESFCGTQAGDNLIHLEFAFGPEPARRIDLLTRKLVQLTECLEVARDAVALDGGCP